ncbi:MAG: hypothetical protein IJ240_10570 [Clostridia bacterium]|nr:hypothetical protein [Clostridia bacterium]
MKTKLVSLLLVLALSLSVCAAVAETAAEPQTGSYELINVTGEKVVAIYLIDKVTGEVSENFAGEGLAADASVTATKTIEAGENGEHRLLLVFVTESGYVGTFNTLSIETAKINLLDADAASGATMQNQIKFTF